jgi:hypothetical protein
MEPKKKPDNKSDREVCRAIIEPLASTEAGDYDFQAVAIPSENKQLRYSWENDEYFYQVLRTAPENINTSRMDSGLPLFDNHPYDTSTINQLGITVGYDFTPTGIVMRVKFGARADEALRKDVQDKIVKTVSIEGSIINYTIERKEGALPVYYADLWEPESLSFAPVPQDISAQIEVKRALADQIEKSKQPPLDSSLNILLKKF